MGIITDLKIKLRWRKAKKYQTKMLEAVGKQHPYEHTNTKGVKYYLFCTDVTLRGGASQRIYFFRADHKGKNSQTGVQYLASPLPEGYIVRENPRNGFLTVGRYGE